MGFPVSTVGVDSGYAWETNLNSALTVIDAHNHSPGQGQQIQPNGLNISSDLAFQSNNATLLRAVRFSPQLSPIPNSGADVGELYVSGNELYYNDVTGGNQVQLTASGVVNATSSGISSGTATAAFSGGVLLVKSSSTSYADIAVESVRLSNNGNLVNQLTLQAPTLSGSINQTLPALPASVTSIMQMDTGGNMSAALTVDGSTIAITSNIMSVASGGITATQLASNSVTTVKIADANVTRPKLVAVGQQVSASSGSFSTTSATTVDVTNLTVTITTTGRPVMVFLQPAIGQPGSLYSDAGGALTIVKTLVSTPTVLNVFTVSGTSAGPIVRYPLSTVFYLDTSVVGAANTYTYKVTAQRTGGTSSAVVQVIDAVLVAYEL